MQRQSLLSPQNTATQILNDLENPFLVGSGDGKNGRTRWKMI
jgi:hypothetical protein